MYKRIFINQCGYQPYMEKLVTFNSTGIDKPVGFSVLKSDGTSVYSGTAAKRADNPSAKEVNYIGDFSEVTAPGRYYITADGYGESDTFEIGADVYNDVFQKASAFFYLQRCGCAIPKRAGGIYSHDACHTEPAVVYGSDRRIDVSGGWHDAGDYGRYIAPAAMAVAQLMYAYEENKGLSSLYLSPDSEINDTKPSPFLDEIKYELDWMLKMQDSDGKLFHKVSCRSFCGFIMPDMEKEELVISPPSVTATADFAAAAAMASRLYRKADAEFSDTLANASKRAYEAMRSMTLEGGFKNPPEISTGEYGDACDTDERYWAAAELYKTFGDEQYRKDFEQLASEKIYHGYGWEDMGSYGNRAYITCGYPVDAELAERIKASMLELADELLANTLSDGYGVSLTADGYIWGSNLYAACNGIHLYDAYKLTNDTKYLNAAAQQLHYLLGRNPMGLCYLTGCGTDAVKHPHHRPSGFNGRAMAGMLSGGPCSARLDELAKQMLSENTAPAKAIVDMTGSYSTNEVTVYWNSALVQLLAEVVQML